MKARGNRGDSAGRVLRAEKNLAESALVSRRRSELGLSSGVGLLDEIAPLTVQIQVCQDQPGNGGRTTVKTAPRDEPVYWSSP